MACSVGWVGLLAAPGTGVRSLFSSTVPQLGKSIAASFMHRAVMCPGTIIPSPESRSKRDGTTDFCHVSYFLRILAELVLLAWGLFLFVSTPSWTYHPCFGRVFPSWTGRWRRQQGLGAGGADPVSKCSISILCRPNRLVPSSCVCFVTPRRIVVSLAEYGDIRNGVALLVPAYRQGSSPTV